MTYKLASASTGAITVSVAETVHYTGEALTANITNGGTLAGSVLVLTGNLTLTDASTTRWHGDITGDITLTGTAGIIVYGNVTGDIDSGNGTTVTVYGDVVGATETNASGSIVVHGLITGASTGTGTEQALSTRVLGMLSGGGATVLNAATPYTHLVTDVTPLIIDTTGGVVEIDLVAAATWIAANPDIPFVRITAIDISNAATVDPNGAEVINDGAAGAPYTFATAYDSIDLYPISGTGWVIR